MERLTQSSGVVSADRVDLQSTWAFGPEITVFAKLIHCHWWALSVAGWFSLSLASWSSTDEWSTNDFWISTTSWFATAKYLVHYPPMCEYDHVDFTTTLKEKNSDTKGWPVDSLPPVIFIQVLRESAWVCHTTTLKEDEFRFGDSPVGSGQLLVRWLVG